MSLTFPQFPLLPSELQLEIWSHAAIFTHGGFINCNDREWDVDPPRTGHGKDRHCSPSFTMASPSSGTTIYFHLFGNDGALGTLLVTCRHSRILALKLLRKLMEEQFARSAAWQEKESEFEAKTLGVIGELIQQHNKPPTFPQFPSLPLELQLQIWSYAALSTRGRLTNVNDKEWHIYIKKTGHNFYDSLTMVAPSGKALHLGIYSSTMGTLLQTCRHSRRETSRGLKKELEERLATTCALQSQARWWEKQELLLTTREFEERSLQVVVELIEYTA